MNLKLNTQQIMMKHLFHSEMCYQTKSKEQNSDTETADNGG